MIGIVTSKTQELQGRRPWPPYAMNRDSAQAEGIVAWWPLPYHPVTAWDIQRRQWDLTNNGGVSASVDPLMGPVFAFDDASSQYFEVGSPILAAPPLSFTAWGNSDDQTINQVVVSIKASASAATRDLIYLYLIGSGTDTVGAATASGSGYSEAVTTTTYVAGAWEHWAAVYASSSSRAAYRNGGGKGTESTSRVPGTMNTTSIGRRSTSTFLYFSGKMADVRCYNRALTDSEVFQQWDAKNRWDLYYPLARVKYSIPKAGAAAFDPTPYIPIYEQGERAGGFVGRHIV